jgi:hypothetical protein
MDNLFFDTSLQTMNWMRRAVGSKWLGAVRFDIETPEPELNGAFSAALEETDRRLSLPFGIKLFKNRWLHSTKNSTSASATETAFAARLISLFDPELAIEIVRPFLNNQSPEGVIPRSISPFTVSPIPASPFLIETIFLLEKSVGIPNIPEIFEKLQKFSNWLILHKKEGDGLFIHGDAKWFFSDPLQYRLRQSLTDRSKAAFEVRSVAFNSLISYQFRVLSRLARGLNETRAAAKYEDFAVQLSDNILKSLWNEEEGFFNDRISDGTARADALCGFLSLAAEIPTRAQAERMLARLPEVRESLPLLKLQPYIAPAYYAIADGLIKYGYAREAAGLALELIRFTPTLSNHRKAYLPNLISQLLLVSDIAGFKQFRDRYVLYPKLPESWAGKTLRIGNARLSHNFTLTLRTKTDIDCRINSAGAAPVEMKIENYTFKNIPLPIGGKIKQTGDSSEENSNKNKP